MSDGVESGIGTGPAIAITGLAGRFPGAATLAEFWQAICAGRDLIRPHDPALLADNFSDAIRGRAAYVPVRPSIADVDLFDAGFFDMLPREAALTDPQYRIFLECCWHALEDAGCDPARAPGPVGVFGGASLSTYFLNNVLGTRQQIEDFCSTFQLGDYQQTMGAYGDTLATRVAFRLGLTGPALTIGTACSTSLAAVAQACASLEAFQCDLALAGGVAISFPQERGYLYQEGGMASRDGHCRPFDADATGTVFGHGAGVVALRRLEDALADGDRIYALIRGVGLNNDGADKIAFTAPSVTGQAMAIAGAQGAAGVDPGSISYVECHGTGTPLGDPIEFEGLKRAFSGVAEGSVALGSVKANIGHCDAAAGVMGLIKTALMLHHRILPPMTNFRAPNPNIDLATSPFHIPTKASPWQGAQPLRAGISALGVGGTNVHLILEQAPPVPDAPARVESKPVLLPLSARSQTALAAMAENLAAALEGADPPLLADAGATLQGGRRAFEYRHCIAASDHAGAVAALRAPFTARKAPSVPPPVAFMFPGQGAQYPGMGAALYADEPAFARIIDAGAEVLRPALGLDLAALLYRAPDPQAAARILRDTAITQPALYLVEYALARLWQGRGVQPVAMIGHSVGEFVAATISGVMGFETGLALIAARARLMQDQPGGAMLSVRAGLDAVAGLVPDGVDLAAQNAPRLLVFAGPDALIDDFAARLERAGHAARRLHTSHAFHSAMMDPVVDGLRHEAAKHSFGTPQIPWVSCVSGTWITADQARDPAYWARHCRAMVNFDAAVQLLCEGDTPPALLETGPGRTLCAFAGQALARDARAALIQSLPDHTDAGTDHEMMAQAYGALWSCGAAGDFAGMAPVPGRRVSLPGYPFERSRHWIDAPVPLARQGQAAPDPATTPTRKVMPMPTPDRHAALTGKLLELLSDLAGEALSHSDAGTGFLELGFDSLLLGQVTQRLERDFGASLTFRQLLGDYPNVTVLAAHLDAILPPEAPAPSPAPQPAAAAPVPAGDLGALMQAQTQAMLQLFDTQLRSMTGAGAAPAAPAA
ncbi:MAG: beta-ketoacyl synthase N-terminal-like domain-containing protein, partial [Paracoccus sp. (in: a-proteobacteria)]|nr:beta-ketoacyl synthase N-terminal-like domain-containing protein [Paracoccus sp. (in: a-proteobacteria)]